MEITNLMNTKTKLLDNETEKYTNRNSLFNEAVLNMTIHGLFEEQVKRTPDKAAVIYGNTEMSYNELNIKANNIAWTLIKSGVKAGDIVALIVERSPLMLIGMLGILKAGAAYLPIDPEYPDHRIRFILEDSKTEIVLTQQSLRNDISLSTKAIYIDSEDTCTDEEDNPPNNSCTRDLAYIIYTSGSTGKPKGVMIEHASVVNLVYGVSDKIDFSSDKSILALTTICFDISVLETLVPLAKGMRVVIAGEEAQKNVRLLSDIIFMNNVDMLQITPSGMQMLINNNEASECLRRLKQIMLGGEELSPLLLAKLRAITEAKIYNMYGPTETTVWSLIKELTESENITIGTPIANTQVLIIDSEGREQTPGQAGELCISGLGLARGYLGREELTKEKFITNPTDKISRMYKTGDLAQMLEDGDIKYIGRIDNQVKILGHRIEPEEIERHIEKYPDIKACVAVGRQRQNGDKYLAVYYTSDKEIEVNRIIEFLDSHLPEYMVPKVYMRVLQFQLTPNGKIDRNALPEPDKERPSLDNALVMPETEIEKVISDLWKKILNKEIIGINDNFFDLGGNSLLLSVMYAELEAYYPEVIEITDFFAFPTVSKLAQFINEKQLAAKGNSLDEYLLGLPMEYFNEIIGGDSEINVQVTGNINDSIARYTREKGLELYDILITAFIYLLHEISGRDEIILLYSYNMEELIPLHIEFSEIEELDKLFTAVSRAKSIKADAIHIAAVKPLGINSREILPLFCIGEGLKEYIDRFGMMLAVTGSYDGIEISLKYDSLRLNREYMHKFLYDYLKVIKAISSI